MRRIIAAICAFLLLAVAYAADAQTVTGTLMGGGSSGGGGNNCGTVPAIAAANGLNTCTFQAGPFTTANFDSTASQGAGFKLYMDDCGTTTPDPTNNFINGSGQLSVGQSAGGLQHSVASSTCTAGSPCPTCWHGTAFGGSFYLEEKATVVQSTAGVGHGSWPAMWLVSLESRTGEAQWPGQVAGYVDYAEFDFPFEYFQLGNGDTSSQFRVSTHNWYNTLASSKTTPSSVKFTAPTFGVPHIFGVLFLGPATGSTAGTCGSINLYIDGALQGTVPWTWSVYNSGTAPPPSGTGCPGVSQNMAIADVQHLMLRFDSYNGNPLLLDYANVWQVDASNNRTN